MTNYSEQPIEPRNLNIDLSEQKIDALKTFSEFAALAKALANEETLENDYFSNLLLVTNMEKLYYSQAITKEQINNKFGRCFGQVIYDIKEQLRSNRTGYSFKMKKRQIMQQQEAQ